MDVTLVARRVVRPGERVTQGLEGVAGGAGDDHLSRDGLVLVLVLFVLVAIVAVLRAPVFVVPLRWPVPIPGRFVVPLLVLVVDSATARQDGRK
ncbi:hypothetical protein [Natronococcus sp.]|uniref:hypothetical protein n=1 Tax=Natronococcus sp. TaxID=35747 RepID=UPI003A4D424C